MWTKYKRAEIQRAGLGSNKAPNSVTHCMTCGPGREKCPSVSQCEDFISEVTRHLATIGTIKNSKEILTHPFVIRAGKRYKLHSSLNQGALLDSAAKSFRRF